MITKKILVTGGPVNGRLDDVKIITNRFRGGLMQQLAEELGFRPQHEVTYLTSNSDPVRAEFKYEHNKDIEEYQAKVLALSPGMDAVVLGAAVANLIPAKPFVGKFPSHNYKPGDIIPIDFTIAPRIIDMVKSVAPKAHLFGFKLLSHVSREELVSAAYEVLIHSKASAIFANDTTDLQNVIMVTKERGEHPIPRSDIAKTIEEFINDKYYRTDVWDKDVPASPEFNALLERFGKFFKTTPEGYVFGTIAWRNPKDPQKGFHTTGRGKKEIDSHSYVINVNHARREVLSARSKPTLNAPLLHHLFQNQNIDTILHFHKQIPTLPVLDYAPSGTVRDSIRQGIDGSFNIRNHGCYLLIETDMVNMDVLEEMLERTT